MASSHTNIPKNIKERANTFEDEIYLIDYLRVVWKRKYFILLGSALPALLVCLILFLSPGNYKLTYTYDIGPYEKTHKVLPDEFYSAENVQKLADKLEKDEFFEKGRRILLDRFFSAENLDNLAAKLKENGFDEYAQEMSKANIQLEISDTLLAMTIVGRPRKDMQRISSIVRDNFEKVIPIYSVKEELSSAIAKFKSEMADIEENKFSLELELEREKAILTKLKNLAPADPNKIPGHIILQFDNINGNSKYLPLAYQIQAAESKIIDIEETINANQQKYNYCRDLLSLNEKLFDEVKNKTSSYYDIREFHSFLTNIVSDNEDEEFMPYLNAYIKKIENAISANTPFVEKPRIYPVPKDTVKKTGIVFTVLLIVTTFAAFLSEAIQKSQAPAA